MMNEYLQGILPKLKDPMPYKWRVQSFSKFKPEATCVAYIDARDVMDRLDKVCIYGWQREHREIKENIYCGIGITMPDGSVQWRWDCGTESETEAEKGESSDSFKRAAVNWGIGRFLYDLEIVRLPANEKKEPGKYPYIVDSNGKRVWDLTKHINATSGAPRTMPVGLTISQEQFDELNGLLDICHADKEMFCKHFKVKSVAALKAVDFDAAVEMVKRKIAKS